jgi:hypothetical protein
MRWESWRYWMKKGRLVDVGGYKLVDCSLGLGFTARKAEAVGNGGDDEGLGG